tara:strand:+ start:178 stop:633 length:456 start_codon:yes stop_codon:yes gene_type:complete
MYELLALAAVGVSAFAQAEAGRIEEEESKLNVFNIATEKKMNKAQAEQVAMARKQEFDFATDANWAALSATGRDVGGSMSVKAFMQRQKETAFEDISRGQTQSYIDSNRYDLEALVEGRRGKNAKKASLFNAFGTLAGGVSSYGRTRSGTP